MGKKRGKRKGRGEGKWGGERMRGAREKGNESECKFGVREERQEVWRGVWSVRGRGEREPGIGW